MDEITINHGHEKRPHVETNFDLGYEDGYPLGK